MTTGNHVTTNEFVPTLVVTDPNGRASANPDLAFDTLLASERNFANILKRHAYARLNDDPMARSNPPFNYGSAGRLTSIVTSGVGGNDPHISRGYIRRSNTNSTDPTSGYRLYFMFNPEAIQRNYVAYLEQNALDPFNTIYGANNLVAPPGVLDFEFSLMFDRQVENANGDMPRGVLEDFDYFDLVVRGTVPGVQSNAIQDNGIMMINPRNITVVFSPQLSVQGRPYRASVVYEKFDNNMTPTRMTVHLSMKVYYFGPVREDFSFASTESVSTFEATIPYDETVKYEVTYSDVTQALFADDITLLSAQGAVDAFTIRSQIGQIGYNLGQSLRLAALRVAEETFGERRVPYEQRRPISPEAIDCSGLVIWAYTQVGGLQAIGQTAGSGSTHTLYNSAFQLGTVIAGPGTFFEFNDRFIDEVLEPGDLMLSYDKHIAFVVSKNTDTKKVRTYESTPWGPPAGGPAHYEFSYAALRGEPNYHTHVIRPSNIGADAITNIGTWHP